MPAPVIIEAAITPLRWGVPAQSVETMVREASDCIAHEMIEISKEFDVPNSLGVFECAAALAESIGREVVVGPDALGVLRASADIGASTPGATA